MTDFSFLGLSLRSFSLLLALGSSGGLLWALLQVDPQLRPARFYAGLGALAGAFLGARLAYLGVHWSYWQAQPGLLWRGGLAWPGAIAGGLLGLWWVSARQQHAFGLSLADLLPLFYGLSLAGWLGCWLDGLAYGAQTQAWWGWPAIDEWGQITPRFPLQLLAALASLGLLWFQAQLRPHLIQIWPGLAAGLGLAGLLIVMLLASLLRADPAPTWQGLRLESWAALGGLAVVGGGGLGVVSLRWVKKRR